MPSLVRTSARSLIAALALCTALAIVPATSASAATRPDVAKRGSQRLTAQTFQREMRALIRSRTSARSAAEDRGPELFVAASQFHFRSHDPNFPDWFAGGAMYGGEAYVAFETEHESDNGYEEYLWMKEVPAADVTVGKRPTAFAIHTGTDLGSFGSIDMTFTATHVGTHLIRCRASGKVEAIERRVQGSFSGTLSFVPGGSGFPAVVHATHPHGSVERIVTTGVRCPRRFQFGCYTSREFSVTGPNGGRLSIDPRYGFTQVETITEVDGFTVLRLAAIFPGFDGHRPVSPVTLTRASLTIDGAMMGSLFDGTVVFDRSSPAVVRVGRCKKVKTPFVWSSGSLDVNFASGTYSFTGADLSATLEWRGPAR